MQKHDRLGLRDTTLKRGLKIEPERMNRAMDGGNVVREIAGRVDVTTISYYPFWHEMGALLYGAAEPGGGQTGIHVWRRYDIDTKCRNCLASERAAGGGLSALR